MYIPYEKIGNFINNFIKNENLKSFFYNKKLNQNLKYIEKNKPNVLKKLKNKLENHEKINVIFSVYDETKWKMQSLYDRFSIDERFNCKVIAAKSGCMNSDNPSYQAIDDVLKTYDFFKDKKMNVEFGYDIKNNSFIPFERFNPDIIFYQHPWYNETSQNAVVCSAFALTCYVPYFAPLEINEIDYYLRFHQYVENYYVLNDYFKEEYSKKMQNKAKNVKALGYPFFDLYLKENNYESEYYIYAPHWTIKSFGMGFGTFDWSGMFMLEYAKNHPGIKWAFKPHPLLFKALIDNKIFSEEQARKYYDEWGKIGIKCETGDYIDLFLKSKMMITDSSSFLNEYFLTGKPLIHLMSEKSIYKNSKNPILKTYYRANNLDELKKLLNELPLNDYLFETRQKTRLETGMGIGNCACRIFDDVLNQISEINLT